MAFPATPLINARVCVLPKRSVFDSLATPEDMGETESVYQESLKRLTRKGQAFVQAYLTDRNAARAARFAGYSKRSDRAIGWENLTKPDIAAAVSAGLDMLAARAEITAERVLREIAAVAFASASHFVEAVDGSLTAEEGTEASGAALQVRHRRLKKDDGTFETETVYQQQDKLKALQMLGKKFKLFVERVEVENAQDLAYLELLRQIRAQPRQ
jgi:phage terminase small subunit